MALVAHSATILQALPNSETFNSTLGRPRDPSTAEAATVAAAVAVAADVATLVADAASPTQAHVTTLNGHYTTLAAAIATLTGNVSGDLVILINRANVDTKNKFLSLLRQLQAQVEATY